MSIINYYECTGTCDVFGHPFNPFMCSLIGFMIPALAITMLIAAFFTIYRWFKLSRVVKE